MWQHSISNQSFTDNTQLHNSCHSDQIDTSVQSMQDWILECKDMDDIQQTQVEWQSVCTYCVKQNLSSKSSSSLHLHVHDSHPDDEYTD